MRIHFLQHVEFEGPAYIETWAKEAGHSMTFSRMYRNEALPITDALDMLVIMGGPMSIHDEYRYTYLVQEKQFIKQCIDADKYVFGICLVFMYSFEYSLEGKDSRRFLSCE